MIRANLSHFSNPPKKGEDKVSYELQSAVNVLYLLYTPLEHIAWLSDLKLLPFDSARWFRYSLYVWTAALICSIMRSLRVYFGIQRRRAALEFEGELSDAKKRLALEEQEELLSLLSFTTDFINAVNFLPFKGFLWAQTFPAWKTGAFGFIASFAGLLKIYRATKRH
uniref:Peroxisomal membrane protein 11C n=1 Tax=Plectus sambesii TaxID=2011161 RepID=A0A914UNL3_9BILA